MIYIIEKFKSAISIHACQGKKDLFLYGVHFVCFFGVNKTASSRKFDLLCELHTPGIINTTDPRVLDGELGSYISSQRGVVNVLYLYCICNMFDEILLGISINFIKLMGIIE